MMKSALGEVGGTFAHQTFIYWQSVYSKLQSTFFIMNPINQMNELNEIAPNYGRAIVMFSSPNKVKRLKFNQQIFIKGRRTVILVRFENRGQTHQTFLE